MALPAHFIRAQLALFHPLLEACSLETCRKWQDKVGELMEARHRKQLLTKSHPFEKFEAAWIIPKDERRQGVILYLHGGGYTCGGLDYAKGFGSTLAYNCGMRVFCAAYRLAPEHKFPAPLEDALEAYQYLLQKGYDSKSIVLCGESAGGGLSYALCLKLKEESLPLPGGLITISPWTDLTASGESYEKNREIDPTITKNLIQFYGKCYLRDTDDPENPLISPLFGDLEGLPPSLLFVGADEILLSDTTLLHDRLLQAGCTSKLRIAPERWHGYLLYNLQEDQEDFARINQFLSRHICKERKLRWMPLDNAAKLYPAARSQTWTNVFRLSATLQEPVDTAILQSALDVTVRRFPSISSRLRKGLFWYYLQQVPHAPDIREDSSYPLARMSRAELHRCSFRILVYRNRIAAEFFHSLTDGTGGLIFLKTLLAEYLQQKHGISIPAEHGILGRLEEPSQAELEDSFPKYAGPVRASRKENTAWRLKGTIEPDGFLNLTCFHIPAQLLLDKAHEHGVSLTALLCAVMMQALLNLQAQKITSRHLRKPIRVQLPVNLRNIFPSQSLRNFAFYTTPEVDPKLGDYAFDELCRIVHHHMGLDLTAKQMACKIATNVHSEQLLPVKLMPLFVKNIVMKAIFLVVGERKSCLSLSNLGRIQLPDVMTPYIRRMDFILNSQSMAPHNCGALTYGDTLYVNFTRNIQEPNLEYAFFQVLRDMGIPVEVESNQPQQ